MRRLRRPDNVKDIMEKMPLWVDSAMVIALLSLAYWVGVQANRIDGVVHEVQYMQVQLNSVQSSTVAMDVAVLKKSDADQDVAIRELRVFLDKRFDALEHKLDQVRNR